MANSVGKSNESNGMGAIWIIISIIVFISICSLSKGAELNVQSNVATNANESVVRNSSSHQGINLDNFVVRVSDNYDEIMACYQNQSGNEASTTVASSKTNESSNRNTTNKKGKRYVTDDEFYWLTMLVCCEGGHEPREGQIAIVATVLNRLGVSYNGATSISDVIFAPEQYSCVWDWEFHLGSSTVYRQDLIDFGVDVAAAEEAVNAALEGEDPTAAALGGGAYYYYNPDCTYGDEYNSRESITNKIRIGNHVFYRVWD